MARDGSGNFTRSIADFVSGTTIDSSDFNDMLDDMETALSDSINKNGTKAFVANQPMGGYVLTGLGAGAANGQSVRYEQLTALSSVYQPLDATITALGALTIASGKLIKGTGTDTFTTIDITSNAEALLAGTTLADFTLLYTDAGAGIGPQLILDRNSASPAASDVIGGVLFRGRDSGGATVDYARVWGEIIDPTDGSENGRLVLRVFNAAPVGSVEYHISQGFHYNGLTDQGAGTLNVTALYENNTSLAAKYAALASANSFTAAQTITSASTGVLLTLECTDAGATNGPGLELYRNSASPAANDEVGYIAFNAKDSGGTKTQFGAIVGILTDPTDASEDFAIRFETRVAGSGSNTRMLIGGGIYHSSATGGDKGNNTINFGAVYDDNTLLTCFVLEYANTGAIDLSFWDALSPTGRHEGAHRFNEQRHLLDIDAYIDFWKTHGHLPGLPSREEWEDHARDKKPVGDMISRLWQTVEMQAVHISTLNQRLKEAGI